MLRPTVPTAEASNDQSGSPDDADTTETESRGESSTESQQTAPARTRRKRTPAAGKPKARNLHLTDDVHDRLWQYARQKKISVSAAANDLLDKSLPRYEVKRVG